MWEALCVQVIREDMSETHLQAERKAPGGASWVKCPWEGGARQGCCGWEGSGARVDRVRAEVRWAGGSRLQWGWGPRETQRQLCSDREDAEGSGDGGSDNSAACGDPW